MNIEDAEEGFIDMDEKALLDYRKSLGLAMC